MTKIGEHKHCVKCSAVIPPECKYRPLTALEDRVWYYLDVRSGSDLHEMCTECWEAEVAHLIRRALAAVPSTLESAKREGYIRGWKDGYDRKPVVPGAYPRCPLCDEILTGRKCPKCGRKFLV